MEKTKLAAEREGKVAPYVGSSDVKIKDMEIGLENFDRLHPIAAVKGSGNLISFYARAMGEVTC
jgi:homoserine dehydrogenase